MTTTKAADKAAAEFTTDKRDWGNSVFAGFSTGSAILILGILAAVATFLLLEASPAFTTSTADFADEVDWLGTEAGETLIEQIGYLVYGTVLISAVALLIATPLAIGIALFISHYAPRRLAATLGYMVDLLAAVPSVVYGLWGAFVLVPFLRPAMEWLANNLGWIPLFEGVVGEDGVATVGTGRVALAAALVLGIMVLPIITAVTREVFLQTPSLHEEAALAMGATRWEMIKMAVFPYGRSGMIGATMLGLGRALGETMAVYMVLGPGLSYSLNLLAPSRQSTIAANIALKFPEANAAGVTALISMGLALFVITLLVNMLARWIVAQRAEFSGAN